MGPALGRIADPCLSLRPGGMVTFPFRSGYKGRVSSQRRGCGHSMPDVQTSDLGPFEGLSPDEVRTILSGTTTVRLAQGDPLFQQGDPPDRFFLLRQGWPTCPS